MDTRLHNQAKTPPASSVAPVQTGLFQQRPFNEVAEETTEGLHSLHQPPDLQTQLDRAARFGHNFSRVKVVADAPPPVMQPQWTLRRQEDQQSEQEVESVVEPVKMMAPPVLGKPIQREEVEEPGMPVQAKYNFIAPRLQREEVEEPEMPVQAKYNFIAPRLQREEVEEPGMPVQSKYNFIAPRLQREAQEQEPMEMIPQLGVIQRQEPEAEDEPVLIKGVQPKLVVGQRGDKYEQEADSMAAQVMSMSTPPANSGLVQRQGEEEKEPLVQRSPLADSITPLVQRQEIETTVQAKCSQCEQEEQVQTKAAEQGSNQASSNIESQLSSSKGGGSPLPDEVRSFMEPRFGADFSKVRVHTDSSAVQMNKALGAQAFTHGSDIYYGAGKSPGQNDLTAHELTHVVQQTGAVQPKLDGDQLGNHAERVTPTHQTKEAGLKESVDTIAVKVIQSLQADPEDRSRQVRHRLAMLEPSTREAVLARVQAKLPPAQWQSLKGMLTEHTPPEGDGTSPSPQLGQGKTASVTGITTNGTPPVEPNGATDKATLTKTTAHGSTQPGVATEPIAKKLQVDATQPQTVNHSAIPSAPTQLDGSKDKASHTGNSAHTPTTSGNTPQTLAQKSHQDSTQQQPHHQAPHSGTGSPTQSNPATPHNATDKSATPTSGAKTGLASGSTSKSVAGTEPVTESTQGAATKELAQFRQEVAAKRAGLLQSAEPKKQQIQASAKAEKLKVQQSINVEAKRLEGIYDQEIQKIQQALKKSKTDVLSQRDTKIKAVSKTAQTELTTLKQKIQEKQKAMHQAGEDKATAAIKEGETQAQRALGGCRQKADQATAIGNSKAQQYSGSKHAADIASAAHQMASEAAQSILKSGNDMAATARKDAKDLASKFRKEAKEAADKFTDSQKPAQKKIEQERDKTIEGLKKMAQDTISHLESTGSKTMAQLKTGRQGAGQQIRQMAPAAMSSIDQSAQTACHKVDHETAQAAGQLDGFANKVVAQLSKAPAKAIKQNLQTAHTQLNSVLSQYDAQMNRLVADTKGAIQGGANKAQQQASQQVNQLAAPVHQAGTGFQTNTTSAVSKVTQKMDGSVSKGTEEMQKAVKEVENKLQHTIDQSKSQWAKELDQGKTQISNKIDKGLAKQDEAIKQLGSKIDEKAKDTENQNWFTAALQFVGGMFAGFFEALWDVVKVILIIALVVLVVVAVIALVAFLIGGMAGLLAVIGVIAAVLGAIAAVLEALEVVFLVVFGIIAVATAAYYIYLAITQKNLSAWQRGELFGRAIFEIVSVFFAGKLFAKLGEWLGKLGEGVEQLGKALEEGEGASFLKNLVGKGVDFVHELAGKGANAVRNLLNDEKVVKLLQRFQSGVQEGASFVRSLMGVKNPVLFARLLKDVGSASELEKLLALVGNDATKLQKYLAIAGGDVKNFEQSIARIEKALQILSPQKVEQLYRELGSELFNQLLSPSRNPKAIQDFSRALELAGNDSDASKAIKELLRLNQQSGNVSNAAMENALSSLVNFMDEYKGRVSGDFASRFLRKFLKDDPAQAEAEVKLAEDILKGRTPLGSNRNVEGIPQSSQQGVQTPEYRITGANDENLAEVKMIGDPKKPLSKNGIKANLQKAISQIREQAQVTRKAGGFIRIDASNAGGTAMAPEDIRQAVKGTLWFSPPGDQPGKNFVEWVEFLYNDATGSSQRLLFRVQNNDLVISH